MDIFTLNRIHWKSSLSCGIHFSLHQFFVQQFSYLDMAHYFFNIKHKYIFSSHLKSRQIYFISLCIYMSNLFLQLCIEYNFNIKLGDNHCDVLLLYIYIYIQRYFLNFCGKEGKVVSKSLELYLIIILSTLSLFPKSFLIKKIKMSGIKLMPMLRFESFICK